MNEVQIFNNPDFGEIRTVMIDGEPWFVAKDVSSALGYSSPSSMRKLIDDEDKRVISSSILEQQGYKQSYQIGIINESGLYAAIINSTLSGARKFKRWVTSEVLPSIRKTGGYGLALSDGEKIQLIAKGYTELSEKVQTVTEDVAEMKTEFADFKQELPLFPVDMQRITDAARKKGVIVLGGKRAPAYRNRSIRATVYRDIYQQIYRNFGVSSYKALQRKDCDKAIGVVDAYELPYVLCDMVKNENAQVSLNL